MLNKSHGGHFGEQIQFLLIFNVPQMALHQYDPGEIRTHLYGLGDHCSIQMNYGVETSSYFTIKTDF